MAFEKSIKVVTLNITVRRYRELKILVSIITLMILFSNFLIIVDMQCNTVKFSTSNTEHEFSVYNSQSRAGGSSRSRSTILDLNNDADVTFYGNYPMDKSGDTLWTGDIDGDNSDELLIGTPWTESLTGNVSVIYTTFNSQFDLEQDAELTIKGGNLHGAQDHIAICTGDIDGDGKEDMIIGASQSNSGPSGLRYSAGEVWVVFGDTKSNLGNLIDLKTSADITIFGAEADDKAGHCLSIGDINGDGMDDIVISAIWAPDGSGNGTVYVVFGDTRPALGTQIDLKNAPLTISGIDPEDYTGTTLATGDINGDNKDEIIIGSIVADGPGNTRAECGEVYVVYGDTKAGLGTQIDLVTDADLTIYGAETGDHLGCAIATGDINGDGRNDIISGAEGSDGLANSKFNSGETYIIYGSSLLPGNWDLSTTSADLAIYGADVGDASGSAVAAANVNSDNFDEILIGARYGDGYNNQREDAGETYLIYGDTASNLGTTLDLASGPDITLYGAAPHDHSGSTVTMGDIDGNGKLDIIIGAEDASSQRGNVYLIYTDPPVIENEDFGLVNGYGAEGKICYSRYEPYIFNTTVTDEFGFDDLESVSLKLDLGEFGELEYKWLRQSNTFIEVNDTFDYASITSTSVDSSTDNIASWALDFKLDINFKFPTEELIDCTIHSKGFKGLEKIEVYPNIFKVENDLELIGNLIVTNSTSETLDQTSWTYGGETLNWTGLRVSYEDSDNIYPDDKYFNVTLTDSYNDFWRDTNSSGQYIHIESVEAAVSGVLSHSLSITELPTGGSDVSNLQPFITNVDATLPPAPQNVMLHADSFTDPQVYFDDDSHIYITWVPDPDLESGVCGFYYSLTNNEHTSNGIWTIEPKGELSNVREGVVNVYVWAMDNAGNIGPSSNGAITIDITNVSFENAAPSSAVWQLTRAPICSIRIIDEGGAGLDIDTIQYTTSNDGVNGYCEWQYAGSIDKIDNNKVDCYCQPELSEGTNNYIKWRARDLTGTSYTESEDYLIMVDSIEAVFNLTTPEPNVWLDSSKITCSITITDLGGSGINATSIEYAIATDVSMNYGEWRSAELVDNAETLVHTVELEFQEGTGNYIKWRAMDVAGNGYTVSEDYNIYINTIPEMFITAPVDNSKFITGDKIWFDASESSDFDRDILSFYWVSDKVGAIGYSSQFLCTPPTGVHKIMLYIDDGHKHNISKSIMITIYETDTDGDGLPDHQDDDDDDDRIPDWWEEQYGLDPKYSGDAGIDFDNDGYTNYKEYELNSSPINSSDPPAQEPGDEEDNKTSPIKNDGKFLTLTLAIIIVILIILIILTIILLPKKPVSKNKKIPEDKTSDSEHNEPFQPQSSIPIPKDNTSISSDSNSIKPI